MIPQATAKKLNAIFSYLTYARHNRLGIRWGRYGAHPPVPANIERTAEAWS